MSDQVDLGDGMQLEPADAMSERHRVRRKVGVGLAAVVLVAAVGGVGYGLGHSFADDQDERASDDPSASAEAELPATLPPVATEVATTDASTVSTVVLPPVEVQSDDDTSYSEERTGSSISASGGYGYSMFGDQPLATLFQRTTPDGMVLRAQMGQTWDPPTGDDFGVGGWQPAPWCYESGQLRVSLAGNGAVDVGASGWFREPFKGRSVSWMMLGGPDGQPHWVVVAQAPSGTTNVAVTFADGATDTVEPQNGIAVLAVAGTPAPVDDMGYPMQAPPSFDVTFEGGAEPLSVASGDAGMWADPEYRDSCSPPPPPLPEPGEQPVDPAAAEAQIIDVMTRIYDASVVGEVGLIDDNTGIADARAQVAEGSFSGEAASVQATIEELVFTSPTEAWFRYRVDTAGTGLADRYGIARWDGDAWRVTRDTVCQDLSMAGGDCGGGWQMVQPPSMQSGMWVDGRSEPAVGD